MREFFPRRALKFVVDNGRCPRCGNQLKPKHKDEQGNVHLNCENCNALVLTRDHGQYNNLEVKKCQGQFKPLPKECYYDEATRIREIMAEDPELMRLQKWYENKINERIKKNGIGNKNK